MGIPPYSKSAPNSCRSYRRLQTSHGGAVETSRPFARGLTRLPRLRSAVAERLGRRRIIGLAGAQNRDRLEDDDRRGVHKLGPPLASAAQRLAAVPYCMV